MPVKKCYLEILHGKPATDYKITLLLLRNSARTLLLIWL